MSDIDLIRQAVRTPAFDEALAEHLGLNATDLRCLELLVAGPDMTPGRLAELSGLTSGAITGVLDRLERAGFATRRPDPADRRRVTIEPVPARMQELAAAVAPLYVGIDGALDRYDETERARIAEFLRTAARLTASETARLRAANRGGFVEDTFRAALAGASRGRLVFQSGAPRMALNVAPLGPRAAARIIVEPSASRLEFASRAGTDELIRGSFEGPRPDVKAAGGVVTVRYRRTTVAALTTRHARLALSGEIPWSITVSGGLTDLTGSLDGVHLERLEVDGGANHVRLELPRPHGTSTVRFNGLVSSASLTRPAGIPVALRLGGGVSRLRVDGGRREQVGGIRRYVGPGFDDSPDRYEIEVLGGASDVVVAQR